MTGGSARPVGWRAVAVPGSDAAWTAIAGAPDGMWLFGPGGRWAHVDSGSVARGGSGPWRTAVDAVGVAAGAVVAGALVDGDRPGLCLLTPSDIRIVEVPADGPVGHWPVLAAAPDDHRESVLVCWVDGAPPVLRLSRLDPAAGTLAPVADRALTGVPLRVQIGWDGEGPAVLLSDASGTTLVDPAGRRRALPDASGGSRLTGTLLTTPQPPATIRLLDLPTWRETAVDVTSPADAGDVRLAESLGVADGAGAGRYLHWHTAQPAEGGVATVTGWLAASTAAGRLGPATPAPGGAGLVAASSDRLFVAPTDLPSVAFVGLPG